MPNKPKHDTCDDCADPCHGDVRCEDVIIDRGSYQPEKCQCRVCSCSKEKAKQAKK